MLKFLFIFLFLHVATGQNLYPCRRGVVISLDMSSAIGSIQDETLFLIQKNYTWNAYHSWTLSEDVVRVMITSPNGGIADGSGLLEDDVIELDNTLTRITEDNHNAYRPSDLFRQIRNIANDLYFQFDQSLKYSIVLFTGTSDQDEVNNATAQVKKDFDGKNLEVIVVKVGSTGVDFSQLGTGGVVNLDDADFFFKLTDKICDGVVETLPTNLPTPVPEPVYPSNADIFLLFSVSDCPISSKIQSQVQLIRQVFDNFTFTEYGVRTSMPNPIGMSYGGSMNLWYGKDMMITQLESLASYATISTYCGQGSIYTSLYKIAEYLHIKENSSAIIILFSDSTDANDIKWSGDYRKCRFDPSGVRLITVALQGASSLKSLASPSFNFAIDDYNIQLELLTAISQSPSYQNLPANNCS
uniref:VWFA domain-containing protein n=2 Tax=Panagrolaimus sp. JU765 TaxID=591449 RepID=A0AC34Q3A3_9BILA